MVLFLARFRTKVHIRQAIWVRVFRPEKIVLISECQVLSQIRRQKAQRELKAFAQAETKLNAG
jgi:hypothetical protein